MTDDTPKRRRGRPKGSTLTEEHRAKIAAGARRQHANPEMRERWLASMEPVWEGLRGPRKKGNESDVADGEAPAG